MPDAWAHPQMLLWLAAVPVVIALGVFGLLRKRTTLRRLIAPHLWSQVIPGRRPWRDGLRLSVFVVAFAILVTAAADPRGPASRASVLRRNVDVVIAIDVSRSMRARDVGPDRLERAEWLVRDGLLPAMAGERVALLAFAGEARQICPLTVDYAAARLALDTLSSDTVTRGGSLLGDALRRAGNLFGVSTNAHRLVVLVTDGEDHGSFADAAAAALHVDHDATLIGIGVGDPRRASRIPLQGGNGPNWLHHDGEVVRTRPDFEALRRLAATTGGAFVAGTTPEDIAEAYRHAIGGLRSETLAALELAVRPAQGHWWALVALVLLLIESAVAEAGRQRVRVRGTSFVASLRRTGVVTGAAVLLLALGAVEHNPKTLVERGNAYYARGDYRTAAHLYAGALDAASDEAARMVIRYNRAAALYQVGRGADAAALWSEVADAEDAGLRARAKYNLGNGRYAAALRAIAEESLPEARAALSEGRRLYRSALLDDPALRDARANLELATRLATQIRDPDGRAEGADAATRSGDNDDGEASGSDAATGGASKQALGDQDGSRGRRGAGGAGTEPEAEHAEPSRADPGEAAEEMPGSDSGADSRRVEAAAGVDGRLAGKRAELPHLSPSQVAELLRQVRARDRSRRSDERGGATEPGGEVDRDW